MLSTLVRNKTCPALAASLLLLLAACGGGGGDSPAAAVTGTPPPEVVLAETYTDLVAGTGSTQPGWPAWAGPADRSAIGGVGCTATGTYHQHSLVTIYKDGVRMGPPDNVGHAACSYELHTHDATGMVHIHTDVAKTFTLGQFFTLWGQPLTAGGAAGLAGPVRFYLIESDKLTPYTGDPVQLELLAHREIVIISGTAPPVLPKYRWPNTL